jgi:thiol-disulfide isomerase/thioredoxin
MMIAAQQPAAERGTRGLQVIHALKLGVAVAIILGAIWVLQGGQLEESSQQATSITLAGAIGGTPPHPGDIAPNFTLQGLNGAPVALNDLRGHPVMLNFWASWCPPCRAEMPDLVKASREYRDRGLVVLAVNFGEDQDTVQHYANVLGMDFPIVLDRESAVSNRYNLTGLPTSYFIDGEGTVRDLNSGPLTEKALRIKLDKLLQASSGQL